MRPELPTLIKARAKIADPAMWGKGIHGGERGRDTCCAAEAIEDAGFLSLRTRLAARALKRVIGNSNIADWNDAPERTHAEVLAAFDKAIEAAS